MNRGSALLALLGLLSCGPKTPPPAPTPPAPVVEDTSWRKTPPTPLAPRPFAVPDAASGALSNGLAVSVVSNHEVPKVYVTLSFRDGGWTDPKDRPGLASVSMDMLNEGAGDMSAEQLSLALRRLASDLSTSAGSDGATITLSTLKKNLEPSLDLLALVLTKPTFPASEWEILRSQRVADLATELEDPGALSRRAFWRTLLGPTYLGLFPTEASYKAMKIADMKAWTSAHLRPDRGVAMVGGDITLAEIQPMLESRLKGWTAKGKAPAGTPPTASQLKAPEKTTIYLVDKPGASQSVLRFGRPVGDRTAPDHDAFQLANDAIGGMFTSRVNMDLREQKGYTYGARSYSFSSYVSDVWLATTNVRADSTVDSITEVLKILRGSLSDQPLTAAELDTARGSSLGSFPLSFETPGSLLGGLTDIWRYGLPNDWIKGYPDRLRAVTLETANAAWKARIDPDKLVIVVVGDAASLRTGLGTLNLPIVELDRDGNPLGKK